MGGGEGMARFQPQSDLSSQSLGGGGGGGGGGEAMSGMHVSVILAKTPSNKRRNDIGRRVLN